MGWLLYIKLRLEKLKENSEIISISPEGIQQLEKIDDEQYKDSTTILQLLKENIDMWSADLNQPGEDNVDDI